MKKFMILSILALMLVQGFSQTVNNVPLKDIKSEYILIVGTSKMLSNKVTIEIDFGQFNDIWSNQDMVVLDENGKKVVFNSMIDALNFLSKHGYTFVDAYAITIQNQNVYHYLMRRNDSIIKIPPVG